MACCIVLGLAAGLILKTIWLLRSRLSGKPVLQDPLEWCAEIAHFDQ